MDLPVMPPVRPMLARTAETIPPGMQYEAKWDGFRALVFRDGAEVWLQSRTGKPLARYFPELLPALRSELPRRCVVDGEIVVALEGRLDFEALAARVHPAASRVELLAETTPAAFVAFDVLALEDTSAMDVPLRERRRVLTEALRDTRDPVFVAPATDDLELAREWFARFEGAGLDGVLAKPHELPYRPGERLMIKVKHSRTADCVVAGYREHRAGSGVGSLLLGLHDREGRLQYVGVCSGFTAARGRELLDELAPLRTGTEDHPWAAWEEEGAHAESRLPGAPNRWSGTKDQSWTPLRPERVCEVAYDHMQGDRFRHTTRLLRWRPDREPRDCGYAQVAEPVGYELSEVLTAPPAG
ncbi:ATP-dependent DNA ligase [Streptomyces sp. AJS327]|uniref:ATP-dependent DNA ligase n=1 Tax=Streptomyces sp. AJS327 TaxID=2545265 RepID=UPI0015DDF2DB|nr:ATP-dependent DNA ligase [Streptomyces sp. AJS327]MBA0052325.1 ATP-dependent DNA ligase [Streptomyces sp. AJS327]